MFHIPFSEEFFNTDEISIKFKILLIFFWILESHETYAQLKKNYIELKNAEIEQLEKDVMILTVNTFLQAFLYKLLPL